MLIKTMRFSIFLILLSCIFSSNVNAERKKLVLVGDYWCPYNCTEDLNYQGFLVEVTRRALYIYGIDIGYQLMPWHEALVEIKKGKIDGIVGISDTKGFNVVTTTLPLEYSTAGAFTRANTDNNWVYDGISSLRGKKMGMIMDYNFNEAINNFIGINYTVNPGMFVVEDSKNAVIDSITNLMDGTIDVYVEDQRVIEYYIREHNLSGYINNAGRISKDKLPLYVAFNAQIPNVREYIKFLEEGIASLKATGEYQDLRVKYKMDTNKEGL
jgi:polar amino acid transport system substrate-binding protein